ncbi:hypothetical protein BURCENBC7_AP2854 [Burkholderia cenocepacia BC7]|nr:hypothetical protein BURCENBC7_AP2854 [Burkholderia cenocepacia BC7]
MKLTRRAAAGDRPPRLLSRYARRHDGEWPDAAAQSNAHARSGPPRGDPPLTRHAS